MIGIKNDNGKARLDLLPLEYWNVLCIGDRGFYTKAHEALYQIAQFNSDGCDFERLLSCFRDELKLTDAQLTFGIAEVLSFGARKYAAHNWLGGMDWSRVIGAAMRHVCSYIGGEHVDPETGLNHLYHAACNIVFLMTYENRGLGNDDRYKPCSL